MSLGLGFDSRRAVYEQLQSKRGRATTVDRAKGPLAILQRPPVDVAHTTPGLGKCF
jgi:hypothetical protein